MIRAKVVGGPYTELLSNAPKDLPTKYREQQVYKIRVTKVFKGYPPYQQAVNNLSRARSVRRNMRTKLYTPSGISSCTVRLRPGKIYLLGGNIDYDRLYINNCSWIAKWKAMSRRERKNIKWQFGPNCKCMVRTCYGPRGCRRARLMCSDDRAAPSYVTKCRTKYQYCKFDPVSRSCNWYKPPEFRSCINTIKK